MSIYKNKNKYWISIYHERRRIRRPSPENTCSGARAYEALVRQKLARGEPIIEVKHKKTEAINFNEFSKQWFNVYVKSNNKKSEIIQKESILRNHLKPFFGKKELIQINSLDIEKYKSDKIKDGLKNKTINNQLTVLAKCLKIAEEWGLLEKIPKIKKLKVQPQKFDFLTEEECKLLLDNSDGIFKEMIFFAIKTGLRFGELIAIDWNDVNLNEQLLTVRRSIVLGEMGSTKSNKIRYIPLTDEVCQMLIQRAKKSGYVFSDKLGNPLKQYSCCDNLYCLCKRIGLRKIGWHTFRHTFASHLVQNGVSIKAVQELLGHSNIATTMRYSHLGPSTLREAIRTLSYKSDVKMNFSHHLGITLKNDIVVESSNS
ncbi:MAG TPA: site-specific integrase [Candidatus Cloacimonas acidaminovorans]|nr:site-specific integrase [Candidatus Cloacimonas acidaminovorans]